MVHPSRGIRAWRNETSSKAALVSGKGCTMKALRDLAFREKRNFHVEKRKVYWESHLVRTEL
jgi:hypothetical protein